MLHEADKAAALNSWATPTPQPLTEHLSPSTGSGVPSLGQPSQPDGLPRVTLAIPRGASC